MATTTSSSASTPGKLPDSLGSSGSSGVTWRGFVFGLIAVPLTCLIVSYAEIVLKTLQIGYLQMPPAAIGLLLAAVVGNTLLRKIARPLALSAQDLLIGYVMMVVAAMISSRGLMEKLLPLLISANYFADGGNEWKSLFFPNIAQAAVPFDVNGPEKQDAALRFFEGLRPGETIPWNLWVGPVLLWSVLVLLIFGAFLCLAAILRKQWVDNEKLAFPLVQLPLEMTGFGDEREAAPLWRNRLTWIGFAIPATVFFLNGMHAWYPAIPEIALEINLNDFLQNPPWNGMYYTPLKVSFAVIGFMFLLPSDVVFSLWFFFVLSRVQDVIAKAANMDLTAMPMYPTYLYRGYQAMGAYLVLAGYLFWTARPHLRRVWQSALGERRDAGDDENELLPYVVAFWGFWVCALGAGVFLVWLGMSPLIAALQLFGLFFVIGLVMARSTAEAGLLMTETSFRPVDLVRLFTPLHHLGPPTLTAMAFTDSLLLRDQRSLLLAGFLDGLRIADGAQVRRRKFLLVFGLAILLAMVVAAYIQLRLPYEKGGITLYGYVYSANNKWGFEDYRQYLRPGALPVGWQGPTFLGVGMVVTAGLAWGRAVLPSFPLHPLGYALSSSWTMIVFWFSAFAAWGAKSLILRYGGMRLYRQARPFFLGMILGEFTMALFWATASALLDTPVPPFPWT